MQKRQKLWPHFRMTGSLKKSKQIAHVSSFLRSSPDVPAVAMFTNQPAAENCHCRKWRKRMEGGKWAHLWSVAFALSQSDFTFSLFNCISIIYPCQMKHSLQSKKSQIALLFYCFPGEHLKHFPLQTLWSTDSHNCAIFSFLIVPTLPRKVI